MRVRGACPPPFTLSTITYKVVVYAAAEGADTLPYFYSTSIYVLWGSPGGLFAEYTAEDNGEVLEVTIIKIYGKFFAINYEYGLELDIVLSAHLFMRPCSKDGRRESKEYFHIEEKKTGRLYMK